MKRTISGKVKQYWKKFFEKFPRIEDIHKVELKELEEFLYPLGLHNQRAQQLKTISEIVFMKFDGKLPPLHQLKNFPGIGQYTSSVYAIMKGNTSEIPMDVNITRVLSRLEFTNQLTDFDKYLPIFENKLNKEAFFGILDLSAKICKFVNPNCKICPLRKCCKFPENKFLFNHSYNYKVYSAQIIVLSKREFRVLKTKNKFKIGEQKFHKLKKITYIYVKKPVKALIGVGKINFNDLILTNLEYFEPYIKLNQIRSLSPKFLPRSPFTWIKPLKKFKQMIELIKSN